MKSAEEILAEYEIDYDEQTVLLSAISREGTRGVSSQQIRFKTLDQSVVDDYSDAMARGDEFPPVVLCRITGSNKMDRIDGHHRIAAAEKAGLKKIRAYVLSARTPEPVLAVLRVALNDTHGQRLSLDERLVWADFLVNTQNLTVQEAAAKASVSASRLSSFRQLRAARTKLEAIEVPTAVINSLSQESQKSIAAAPGEAVVRELALLAHDAKLTRDQILSSSHELKELTTERARLKRLEELRDGLFKEQIQVKRVTNRGRQDSDAAKLSRGLGLVVSVSPKKVKLSVVNREDLASRCRQAMTAIGMVLETIDPKEVSDVPHVTAHS